MLNSNRNTKFPGIISLLITLVLLFGGGQDLFGQSQEGTPRLMQGPMVGVVTENTIRIWVRTSGAFAVSIEYDTDEAFNSASETEPVSTRKDNDYALVLQLKGLKSDTRYFYRVKVNGQPDQYLGDYPPFTARTAPKAGTPKDFRIAFGSCARFQADKIQPIWASVFAYQPQLFFWLGDNIYGDALDPDILREEYRRQRDVATLQPVLRHLSNLAIWDDHDFGLNDHDRTNPQKTAGLQVFKEYWANPSYGLTDTPGIFFRYTYGAVDFFFLDIRYHRDPNKMPDGKGKTMLGEKQLQWLKTGLTNSQAKFKILLSGSGWSVAKGHGGDSWAAFVNERNEIFDFIKDNNVSGVILVSGDTHVGELNVIPWSEKGGYDLYEIASSPLGQTPSASWLRRRPERRVRQVYGSGVNFGVIDFRFDGSPRAVVQLIDEKGRRVWQPLQLLAEELTNGTVSWPEKVDARESKRQENFDQGHGYYDPVQ